MKTTPFAQRLKDAIKNRGIGRDEFAAKLNASPSTIRSWASTKRPSTDTIEKMASILGVSFAWLAHGRGNMLGEALLSPVSVNQLRGMYKMFAALPPKAILAYALKLTESDDADDVAIGVELSELASRLRDPVFLQRILDSIEPKCD